MNVFLRYRSHLRRKYRPDISFFERLRLNFVYFGVLMYVLYALDTFLFGRGALLELLPALWQTIITVFFYTLATHGLSRLVRKLRAEHPGAGKVSSGT